MSAISKNNLNYNSNLGGSTGAKKFKRRMNGTYWVVKTGAGAEPFEHVMSEFIANEIYEIAGVPVPNHFLDAENQVLITDYIEGRLLNQIQEPELSEVKQELQKGFVIDALLANWDVIGLNRDNIVVRADGIPVRVDNGGSLEFRAQGGHKDYTMNPTELDTMKQSAQCAPFFGDLTNHQVATQILAVFTDSVYASILAALPADLQGKLKGRMKHMITWANGFIAEHGSVPPAGEVAEPFNTSGKGVWPMPEYVEDVNKSLLTFF